MLVRDRADLQRVRDELRAMGCESEWMHSLTAVDVPPTVAYARVRAYLAGGERDGRFEFEEGCLADEQRQ